MVSQVQDAGGEGRPRILILAFGCNPYAGSESEAGWAMVETISQVADTVTLVRPDHKRQIDRYLARHPSRHMRFVEVPVDGPILRIARLVVNTDRRAWYLAYFSFLRRAHALARRLVSQEHFDAAVHAAYGCYWLPTPLVDLPLPVVWGPVGGATRTPVSLWPYLGPAGVLGEIQKRLVLRFFSFMPSTRRTWRRAAVRLTETENTRLALPRRLRSKTQVVNRGLLSFVPDPPAPQEREPFVLFPSRLEPRKGPRLAVTALAKTREPVRLVFAADGSERKAVCRLAAKYGISDRIDMLGFVPRQELFTLMRRAAAVLFCGLREEGGMALAESMILGSPVIVLGIGGARLIAESNSDPSRVTIIEPAGPARTAERLAEAIDRAAASPHRATTPYLVQEEAIKSIQEAVLRAAAFARKKAEQTC